MTSSSYSQMDMDNLLDQASSSSSDSSSSSKQNSPSRSKSDFSFAPLESPPVTVPLTPSSSSSASNPAPVDLSTTANRGPTSTGGSAPPLDTALESNSVPSPLSLKENGIPALRDKEEESSLTPTVATISAAVVSGQPDGKVNSTKPNTKPKRRPACDRCKKGRTACSNIAKGKEVPNYDTEGKQKYGVCETCKKLGVECTYLVQPKKRVYLRRTGVRIEKAKELFGVLEENDEDAPPVARAAARDASQSQPYDNAGLLARRSSLASSTSHNVFGRDFSSSSGSSPFTYSAQPIHPGFPTGSSPESGGSRAPASPMLWKPWSNMATMARKRERSPSPAPSAIGSGSGNGVPSVGWFLQGMGVRVPSPTPGFGRWEEPQYSPNLPRVKKFRKDLRGNSVAADVLSTSDYSGESNVDERRKYREVGKNVGMWLHGRGNRQNTSPNSMENEIRHFQRKGQLVIDLLRDLINSVRMGFFDIEAGCSSVAINDIIDAFNVSGWDMRGTTLGPTGHIKIATYCSLGALTSTHSAILGTAKGQCPPLPRWWTRDDEFEPGTLSLPHRPPSMASCSPDPDYIKQCRISFLREADMTSLQTDLDLREYGRARLPVQNVLWRHCYNLVKEAGILDKDSELARQMMSGGPRLLAHLSKYAKGFLDPELPGIRAAAVHHFKNSSVGFPLGWASQNDRYEWFSNVLGSDAEHACCDEMAPNITDAEIRKHLDGCGIKTSVFLSYDRDAIPPITDLDFHHKVVRATALSLLRTLALASYSEVPPPVANEVFQRIYNNILSREAWRRLTVDPIPQSSGKVTWMTAFGPERISARREDNKRIQCVWFALLKCLKCYPYPDENLERLKAKVAEKVDELVFAVSYFDDDETVSLRDIEANVSSLDSCPGGPGYLAEFISHSKNQDDLASRANHVARVMRYCKLLAFEGMKSLERLQILENALSKSMGTQEPAVQAEPHHLEPSELNREDPLQPISLDTEGIANVLIRRALDDVSIYNPEKHIQLSPSFEKTD